MRIDRSLMIFFLTALLAPAASASPADAEEVYQTGEIVVTATRTPRPAAKTAGSVVVLEREEIEAAASPDLKTVLRQAPGLFINDGGSPAAVATGSLRGSRSTQVLVLLDGVRLANAQSSFFSLSDLPVPLEIVERVEVIPLPASSLYGADALGGVINIITRPPGGRTAISLSQGAGSFGELRTFASLQAGFGELTARAAGQARSGDGHRDNGEYDLGNVSFDVGTEAAGVGLRFGVDYFHREAESPGHVDFPTPEARQGDEAVYLNFTADWRSNDRWNARSTFFYDSQRREYEDPRFAEMSLHENRKGGIDLQATLETRCAGRWTAGGEWIRDDVESSDAGDHDSSRWAAYLQDEFESGAWTAVGTVRIDDHSVYGSEISPRLLLMRAFQGDLRLWASGARGYRAPNFDDLFWTGGFGRGNPDLGPETSWDIELGGEKRWGSAGRVRLAVFNREVEDLIQWTDPDGDFVFVPENIASARIRGLDAEARYTPLPWLSLPLAYQYLDPEDRDSGDKLEGHLRHLLQAGFLASHGAFRGGLHLTWAERYRRAGERDPGHTVAAATASWKSEAGPFPIEASLRLDNLFDESYETVQGFPMPGRSVYGELRAAF